MKIKSPELDLPCDVQTERLVLGSAIMGNGQMDALRTTVDAEDFSTETHRRIWSAATSLFDSGIGCERVTVYQELARRQEADSVGGLNYLCELDDGLPEFPCLDQYIAILREKSAARRLITAAYHAINSCTLGTATIAEIRETLLANLQSLETTVGDKRPVSSRELVDRIGIEKLLRPQKQEGLRLPWPRLNDALGGMQSGQVIILAAYTSRGKTSMAAQIAAHATRQSTGVFYWTMEMQPEAVFRRMIDQMGNLDGDRRRHGCLSRDEIAAGKEAVGWLYDHPVYFDAHSRTVSAFIAGIRQIRQKHEIGFAVVDHLQLVRYAGRADSRAREVADSSRSLKLAAMDLGIPILVLSQVRRPSSEEKKSRLSLHMLKESGDVENDADVVLLINSAEPNGTQPIAISVNVAKQREGPAGFDVPLIFRPHCQSFESTED